MVNPSHWRLYQNGAAIGSFLEPLQLLYEESLRKIGELYPSTFSSFKYLEVSSTLGSAWIAIRTKGVSKLGNSWQIWAPPKNRPMPDMLTSWGSIWTDAWDQMQITAGLWVQGIVSTVVETIFARMIASFLYLFQLGWNHTSDTVRFGETCCAPWWSIVSSYIPGTLTQPLQLRSVQGATDLSVRPVLPAKNGGSTRKAPLEHAFAIMRYNKNMIDVMKTKHT